MPRSACYGNVHVLKSLLRCTKYDGCLIQREIGGNIAEWISNPRVVSDLNGEPVSFLRVSSPGSTLNPRHTGNPEC